MAQTTFSGPVKSLNGFIGAGKGNVVSISDATLTATVADHAGRVVSLNNATCIVTLPTISAAADSSVAGPNDYNSGNNIGATFTFFIETAATNLDIKTDGTDKFVGQVLNSNTNATVFSTRCFVPAATNDVLTLNGGTQGGKVGSVVKFTALADNKYAVDGLLIGPSTSDEAVATPFADS